MGRNFKSHGGLHLSGGRLWIVPEASTPSDILTNHSEDQSLWRAITLLRRKKLRRPEKSCKKWTRIGYIGALKENVAHGFAAHASGGKRFRHKGQTISRRKVNTGCYS